MKCILLFPVLLLIISCNSGDHSNDKATKTNDEGSLSGCYLRVLKRDTLALSIQQSGKTVTGKLSFDNFEKDGSTGSVTGVVEGDILKLIYNFQSEGTQSVMEVYLKILDGALITGIGDVAVKSDTAYYTDPNQIEYPQANKLEKLDCEKMDRKYK